jgi:hypothetical protein
VSNTVASKGASRFATPARAPLYGPHMCQLPRTLPPRLTNAAAQRSRAESPRLHTRQMQRTRLYRHAPPPRAPGLPRLARALSAPIVS